MTSTTGHSSPSLVNALAAGLAAGAIASILAMLLSLPLRSPDDVFLNTAGVAIGALAAGLIGGALWWLFQSRRAWERAFIAGVVAVFALVAVGAFAAETQLSGMVKFVLPLAAIVLGGVALLRPLFSRREWRAPLAAPAGVVAALAIGIALAGRGDAESGTLALPAIAALDAAIAGQIKPADVQGSAYTIAPEDSAVTYTVKEKLANLPLPSEAFGKTSQVNGTLYLDGRPSTITVDVSTFVSDQAMRDNFIKNVPIGPQLAKFPQAQLTVSTLDLPAVYQEGETVTRTVNGTMTIRGVAHPQAFTVEARLQNGVLSVHGATDFTWADYQIPPPTIASFVTMQDTVHIEVLLVGRGATG